MNMLQRMQEQFRKEDGDLIQQPEEDQDEEFSQDEMDKALSMAHTIKDQFSVIMRTQRSDEEVLKRLSRASTEEQLGQAKKKGLTARQMLYRYERGQMSLKELIEKLRGMGIPI